MANAVDDFSGNRSVMNDLQVNIIDQEKLLRCPLTNQFIKWKVPESNGNDLSNCSQWVLKLQIFHPYIDISNSTIATCIQDNIMTRQVLMERVNYSDGTNLIVSLTDVLKDSVHNYLFDLVLYFHLDGLSFVVCTFKIKVFQIDVESGEISQDEISVRFKKQLSTGPHKGRKQRLEDKDFTFTCKSNFALDDCCCQGYVKRVNDHAMVGKPKAVIGLTKIPLYLSLNTMESANDAEIYVYSVTANLDPEEFYNRNVGKELYMSDQSTPDNNIFVFRIQISIENQCYWKDVYRFKTRTKENRKQQVHQHISAMKLEAQQADIKHLQIERLTTYRGDIAYSWQLNNESDESVERYDEGDVVGIFPSKDRDKTYLDLLTPINYNGAILAGVITRSYYISANTQDETSNPSEKMCMMGKIPVKVYGAVKHGEFLFASNKLPGVAVTEKQFKADNGNLRQKRLLGYSIEESTSSEVKMVDCIVSILLSISNDQIENILAKLEEKMAEDFERKMDEFRDDVDIQMEGMAQIVSNTRDYVAHKGKEISRRNYRVLIGIFLFFVFGALCSYFFLSPGSPYVKWVCRHGSLPGSIKFKITNKNDEKLTRMEGILFDVSDLMNKIGRNFPLKKNFTGSYYYNYRKCKRNNLRKVLGWFSNPPVYSRAKIFAASCDCKKIFYIHQLYYWVEYKDIIAQQCIGQKDPVCNMAQSG